MNTTTNSFFIFQQYLQDEFTSTIQENPDIYHKILIKSERNPFYMDFLRDTWLLFYLNPKNLINDPLRSMYLIIRKSILDIVSSDSLLPRYFEVSNGDKEKSLYYATLLCEVTSLFFKEQLKSEEFQQHMSHVTKYYYQGNCAELGWNELGEGSPKYISSQAAIITALKKRSQLNHCIISELFIQYAYKKISQLDILELNTTSVFDTFDEVSTKSKESLL